MSDSYPPSPDPSGTPPGPDLTKPAQGDTAPYQQPTYQPYQSPGQAPDQAAYPPAPTYQQPAPYGAPGYPGAYTVPPPNEGMGLAAMIIGIISLVLSCGYGIGLLGSPVALVLGRVSMKRIDRSNGTLGGRGMALAGFILGIIGTVLLVLVIIVVVIVVIAAVNGAFDDSGSYSSTYGLAR